MEKTSATDVNIRGKNQADADAIREKGGLDAADRTNEEDAPADKKPLKKVNIIFTDVKERSTRGLPIREWRRDGLLEETDVHDIVTDSTCSTGPECSKRTKNA